MNKRIVTVTLVAFLALMAAGCQKDVTPYEDGILRQVDAEPGSPVYRIYIAIDGTRHIQSIRSEQDYDALLRQLMAKVRDGHEVVIYGNLIPLVVNTASKEKDTYTTSSEAAAVAWTKRKTLSGYVVTVSYDKKNKTYTCEAVK